MFRRSSFAFALATACWALALGAAGCGDDEGPECREASDCPPVDCPDGVNVQVCGNRQCVSDPEIACELADPPGTGGADGAG